MTTDGPNKLALSRKAEGRRQKAEGNSDSCSLARDKREQGFKTPIERTFNGSR
ncbi:MAG: hypothetical protein PUP92_03765 [Rhizonema sp. PD38]|nr:hypothetical protein [Rhizonema sp. PD38]